MFDGCVSFPIRLVERFSCEWSQLLWVVCLKKPFGCTGSSVVPTCSTTVSVTDHSSVAFRNCCCSTACFTFSAALLTSARPLLSSRDCTQQVRNSTEQLGSTVVNEMHSVCYSQWYKGMDPMSSQSLVTKDSEWHVVA